MSKPVKIITNIILKKGDQDDVKINFHYSDHDDKENSMNPNLAKSASI